VLSKEYEHFVYKVLNKDLYPELRVTYDHYDVKANKKKETFPYDLIELSKTRTDRTGFFSC